MALRGERKPPPRRLRALGRAGSIACRLVLVLGCARGEPPPVPSESSLADQVAEVAAGRSRSIELIDTPVGDDEVAQIAALGDQLTTLRLAQAALSEEAWETLGDLTGLDVLAIGGTPCSNEGLRHLGRLTRLRQLNLDRTTIDDEGLQAVAGLAHLELLRLGSSQLRGPGLVHLQSLSQLRHLILQNAPLGDAGLEHLMPLAGLDSLYLEGTEVSEAGLVPLKEHNRGLHLHW